MKKVFIGLAVIIASIANASDRAEFSLNPMLNKVMPAVVNIRAQHENNFSQSNACTIFLQQMKSCIYYLEMYLTFYFTKEV